MFDDDDDHIAMDQHVLLEFYWASSLTQHFTGKHVAPPRHIMLKPSP